MAKYKGSKGTPGNLELRGKITKKMVDAYHSRKKKTSYSPKQVNEIGGTI